MNSGFRDNTYQSTLTQRRTTCLSKQLAMALLAIRLPSILRESATSKGLHAEGTYKVFRMPLLIQCIDHTSGNSLSTPGAEGTSLLMVVGLAIGLAAILVEGTTSEGFLAILANEVFGMPLVTQRVDAFALDRLITPSTSRAERVVKAVLAVWTSLLLEECTAGEGSQALTADEVVRVPLAVESGDTSSRDWFVAMGATRAEELLITARTVGNAVLFVEVAGTQGRMAITAHEVFGMEGAVECLDDLAENGFAAMCTIATR